MQPIYNYENYKDYINALVYHAPNKGRGVYAKMAKYLQVSSVLVSQVLKGDRNFSRDKIFAATQFFGLDGLETEFLLTLFDLNLSKSSVHGRYLEKKLMQLKNELQQEGTSPGIQLSEEDAKVFFSSWLYKATLLTLTKTHVDDVKDIAYELNQPEAKIKEITDFLVKVQFLRQQQDGSFEVMQAQVDPPPSSVHALSNQMNLKNLEIRRVIEGLRKEDFSQSTLVITDEEEMKNFVGQLQDLFARFTNESKAQSNQKLAVLSFSCLNMDRKNEAPTRVITPVEENTFVPTN